MPAHTIHPRSDPNSPKALKKTGSSHASERERAAIKPLKSGMGHKGGSIGKRKRVLLLLTLARTHGFAQALLPVKLTEQSLGPSGMLRERKCYSVVISCMDIDPLPLYDATRCVDGYIDFDSIVDAEEFPLQGRIETSTANDVGFRFGSGTPGPQRQRTSYLRLFVLHYYDIESAFMHVIWTQ